MLNFESDYIEGAHPKILERLVETNMEPLSGYGMDKYCAQAKEKIAAACKLSTDQAKIEFITGGTQTNQLVIDSILKPYEGVVAAQTGHVSVHEAGAIEYTGHKVLQVPGHQGKIEANELNQFISDFYSDGNHEHMVFPGMVYISFPTEYGTIYSKAELTEIYSICKKWNVPLFIDGARLGYGLASSQCDLTLPDIADLCDIFYIGGTKIGALCGEAIVFTKNNEPAHFTNLTKKHGALLAKGRLLGIQFDTLFTDDLYFKISKNAIDKADKLKDTLKQKGYTFLLESPTNQQFVIVENQKLSRLAENVQYSFWEKIDDTHTAIRLATSWATTDEKLNELIKYL